ncbi:MAG: DUF1566 domain-containing protein [Methylococcaceae bacterium]|jgi:hypothetical protein
MKRKGNNLVMIVWFLCFFQTALLPGVSWSANDNSITPILSLLLANKSPGCEPQDCSGVFGETAYCDNCGICVGGTTGKTACAADCNGVFGGTAYVDNCGICVGGNTEKTACTADCNGVFGGTAYIDNCDICVGGTTGKTACVHITRLPDTGQTGNYTATFGEDSDYTINPPSYTDNRDGTVIDNVTGLMWQKDSADGDADYNWYQAAGVYNATYNPMTQNVCAAQRTGGHSDWRLPTKKELVGIVDYGVNYPAINSKFGAQSSYYWSCTTYACTSNTCASKNAWSVNFNAGSVEYWSKSYSNALNFFLVRCVRGGQ